MCVLVDFNSTLWLFCSVLVVSVVWCHGYVLSVLFISFPALDSNVDGGEGEDFTEVFEEEDQGQLADQGKPPLDAYLWSYVFLCMVLQVYKSACFTFSIMDMSDWVTPMF